MIAVAALAGLLNIAWLAPAITVEAKAKVSRFGEYSGYSERRFDGFERQSLYVPMRDGVRLAVDLYHPTKDDKRASEKLPVVLVKHGYWRANQTADGTITSLITPGNPKHLGSVLQYMSAYRDLLEHGYVIAIADPRGYGASFGNLTGFMSLHYNRDSYDLIEWLGSQGWSSGNVGMMGPSYMANAQIGAASEDPPSLKAIFPEVGAFDWSEDILHGGVSMVDRPDERWRSPGRYIMETLRAGKIPDDPEQFGLGAGTRIPPVDGPDGERLLAELLAERAKTLEADAAAYDQAAGASAATDDASDAAAYRSECFYVASCANHQFTGHTVNMKDYLPQLNQAQIPTYTLSGWRDITPLAPLLWHENLRGPHKTSIGPWGHGPNPSHQNIRESWRRVESAEARRWFDYWLKGIENGVMDGPSMAYAVLQHDPGKWTWRATESWPDQNVNRRPFYFSKQGDDLAFGTKQPRRTSEVSFDVDVTATLGKQNRYMMRDVTYPEMSENNSKGAFYTSAPLGEDLTIAGAPVVTLNVKSTAPDGEFHVSLQRVDADGLSHFITEGKLKASHRVLREAPYEFFGLPWQDRREKVVKATPPLDNKTPAELKFRLQPTAFTFEKGSRLRVAIVGADADFSYQEPVDPAPVVTIVSGGKYTSGVELPILED